MKRLFALSALCLGLLAACETAGPRPPPVGPTLVDVEAGRSRVTYRGPSRMSQPEVSDRALLQAADLALMRGYDWFRVTERATDLAPPTTPRFSFGFGTSSFGRGGGVGVGGATSVGGEASYIATLEVVFGRAPRPPGSDVYDARSVSGTLGPRLR